MLRIRQGIFLSLVKLYRLDRNCQSTNGYRFGREIFYIDANELYTCHFTLFPNAYRFATLLHFV